MSNTEFLRTLAIGSAMVAILAWTAAPTVNAMWTLSTKSSAQVKVIEESAYYPNCGGARAAGAAPMVSGTPGYRDSLDRDGDGIACEPHRR
ncbi:hypothetical protein BH10PSE14_BH10PSE14_31600 [soil metagenome]